MPLDVTYSLISKHRSNLMGLAIIWIFLYHSKIYFPNNPLFDPLRFLVSTGFGGVDIFFFLSGFGLMHHMLKSYHNCLLFYKRRFITIFPAYLIATICSLGIDFWLNKTPPGYEIFLNLTTLGYWLSNSDFYWFVSAIVPLYLFYPHFFKYYQKYQLRLVFLISGLAIITSFALILGGNDHFTKFLARIPIFLIGSHVSYLAFKYDNQISKKLLTYHLAVLLFTFGTLLILMFKHVDIRIFGLNYYLFTVGTLPFCILMSIVLDRIPSSLTILSCCGTLSLEIYLIHKQLIFRIGDTLLKKNISEHHLNTIDYGHYLSYMLYFAISFILALLLHKALQRMRKYPQILKK